MSEKPDESLTLDRLQKTVNYHRKLQAEIRERVDGLAVKMGIDPEKDLLIVPRAWCKKYGWDERDFPRWMKASQFTERAFINKDVRNPKL